VIDELVQPDQCLRSCDRPCPIGIGAEGRRRKAIEYCSVDVVELEQLDQGPGATISRRWFAVVMVEVPLATHGLGDTAAVVDQHAESQPLPTVEILHREPLAAGRPACEVVVVA
jgi:hypothetical protein